jgi:flagellar export protein FliJ
MADFAFRLQSVLDYRTSVVDRARLELAALQGRLRDAEDTLAGLQQSVRDAVAELAAAQRAGTLDLPEISRLLEYGQVLDQRIAEQQEVIARRQVDVDAQHEQVVALARDAKALEKLKDRQHEEYQQEDARRERDETSEIAAIRHRLLRVVNQ